MRPKRTRVQVVGGRIDPRAGDQSTWRESLRLFPFPDECRLLPAAETQRLLAKVKAELKAELAAEKPQRKVNAPKRRREELEPNLLFDPEVGSGKVTPQPRTRMS